MTGWNELGVCLRMYVDYSTQYEPYTYTHTYKHHTHNMYVYVYVVFLIRYRDGGRAGPSHTGPQPVPSGPYTQYMQCTLHVHCTQYYLALSVEYFIVLNHTTHRIMYIYFCYRYTYICICNMYARTFPSLPIYPSQPPCSYKYYARIPASSLPSILISITQQRKNLRNILRSLSGRLFILHTRTRTQNVRTTSQHSSLLLHLEARHGRGGWRSPFG